MIRKILLAVIFIAAYSPVFAQDSVTKKRELTFSGSVDVYYRYNFTNAKNQEATNNYTSFTNSQNSFELGMASLKADYTAGKLSATIDLGLGGRAQEFSYAETGAIAAIKQVYICYTLFDKIKLTMGKWGTHLGYEVLDPQFNRNYSMSYLFSYGPFSHTGIKADFRLGSHFGLMAGVANPNDYISAPFANKFVLGQVSVSFDQLSAFLNYVGGRDMDNAANKQIGLTAITTLWKDFSLGYDGTVKFYKPRSGSSGTWWGSALYLNAHPTEKVGITLRGEYFDDEKGIITYTDEYEQVHPLLGSHIFQTTLSFNFKPVEHFTIIPEFRLDSAGDPIFTRNNGSGVKNTGSFVVAAILNF